MRKFNTIYDFEETERMCIHCYQRDPRRIQVNTKKKKNSRSSTWSSTSLCKRYKIRLNLKKKINEFKKFFT